MWCSEKRGPGPILPCLLLLSLLAALATCQRGRLVNCKKMVFAPICRGVAAKRAQTKLNFQSRPQLTYSPKSANDFTSIEKQAPYWFYAAKTY